MNALRYFRRRLTGLYNNYLTDKQSSSLYKLAETARKQLGSTVSSYKTVALNWIPKTTAWGGGNQFAYVMAQYLAQQGHKVVFDLHDDVDVILLVEGYAASRATFFVSDVRSYLTSHPDTLVVHRVNECDQRKGTQDVDAALRETNRVAHRTVFISRWLKEYHSWDAPEQYVITNGCDEHIFHPGIGWDGLPSFQLVTHHWSPNWNKGFHAYLAIDEAIALGVLPDVTLTVIGQWPKECNWRAARLVPPLWGKPLADELRQHHAYITASLWEPCGMHHIEAASCGLPIAYHRNGGGIVEMCSRYGVEFEDNPVATVQQLRSRYTALRQAVLESLPSLGSTRMCEAYVRVLGLG